MIAQAAEKYVIGCTPEEACDEAATEIDTKAMCIAVTKGEWTEVCSMLRTSPNSDARGLRASIVGYLRAIMLETTEFDDRNKVLADCIRRLCGMQFSEDLIIMSALTAELYTLCHLFSRYKR